MKRSLLVIIGLIASASFLFPSFTITNPIAASKWQNGKSYTIQWTSAGADAGAESVRMMIIRSLDNKATLIVNPTPNDGSFQWTVPGDLDSGKYKIRIRQPGSANQYFSPEFEIIEKQSTSGVFINKKALKGLISTKIKFLSPTKKSNWKTGTSHTIKWDTSGTKTQRVYVKLYSHNGKKFVRDIGSSISGSYTWNIPHSVYKWPGYFTVRANTKDNKRSGLSEKFHISTSASKKVYKVYGNTVNKYRFKKKKKKSFTTQCPIKADPGSGKMRIGYDSYWSSSTECAIIYRSFISFNLTPYLNKGLLMKASLRYSKFMGNDCKTRVYTLNEKWNGSAGSLFKVKATFQSNPSDITIPVRKWLVYPNANYGIVVKGPNENMTYKGSCVGYYENVYLELEFIEQKK